jgi:hypothetical protein
LLGHDLPAPQTARDLLAQFHAADLPLMQESKAPVVTAIHCHERAAKRTYDSNRDDQPVLAL